jgi:ABC-2 type transport system permease protein
MTLLGPLLFAGLMVAAIWVTQADSSIHKILIVDESGLISYKPENIGQYVPSYPDLFQGSENLTYRFSHKLPSDSLFLNGPYSLMIYFNDGILENRSGYLYYKNIPSIQISEKITRDLENAIERVKVKQADGLSYEAYKRLKVNLNLIKRDIQNKDTDSYEQEKAAVGMIFSVIIFFFVFLHGAQVMRGVIEEKTSRIVEVIVSSVKPFDLMMGKIVGVGLVGLTQFIIWIVFSVIIFAITGAIFEAGGFGQAAMVNGAMPEMNAGPVDFNTFLAQQEGFNVLLTINWPLMLSMFVLFFIGGYLLYGSMFAAIGAAVDSETDTQQFMIPVMLPLMFSYFVAIMSVGNPDGFASHVFSFIPFSASTVMMIRLPLNSTSLWEVFLSLGILFATGITFVWLAGRIYRTGILMYGKRPSYREMWKWLFYRS